MARKIIKQKVITGCKFVQSTANHFQETMINIIETDVIGSNA